MKSKVNKKKVYGTFVPIIGVFLILVALLVYVVSEKASINQVATGTSGGGEAIVRAKKRISRQVVSSNAKYNVDSCSCLSSGSTLKCKVTYKFPWSVVYGQKTGTVVYGGCTSCWADSHECFNVLR